MSKDLTVPDLSLTKRDGPLEVDVQLDATPDPVVSDEAALAAFERAGMMMATKETVRDLASVGIHVKGIGVLKIQRGRVMMTQQRIDETMRMMIGQMDSVLKDEKKKSKTPELVKLANSVRSLADSITKSQRLAVEIESITVGSGAPVSDTPQATTASFQPKSKVQASGHQSTTIHAQNVFVAEKPS